MEPQRLDQSKPLGAKAWNSAGDEAGRRDGLDWWTVVAFVCRLSFGMSDIGLKTHPTVRPKGGSDPSQTPIPQTPKKSEHGKESADDGVFGVKTEGTPYFQDVNMVPPRSSNRADQLP
ncbi:unnamed protein product [Phytophthora fragariaefolia]|uniref:Unnamed protein product n=1 Tax=Phytophthora fragariaefolia TaxID=1490495 RepID=A0A9W7CIR8_9STRA|nr:unnamed protein product [Phytophthora fragariaefolia]